MDPEDVRRICTQYWARAIEEGPHTSFKMVEVLMNDLGVGHRDLLRNPSSLAEFQADFVDQERFNTTYFAAWGNSTGRCTSFAIKVVDRLRLDYPNCGFRFHFYNMGKHRVARCDETNIVIDSESKKGAEILPNNASWLSTPNDKRGRWRFQNSYSVFEEDGNNGSPAQPRRIYPISPELALGICLEEIAKRAILVCCFRSVNYQGQNPRPEYHGVVRWRLHKRRIELTPNLDIPLEFSTITFVGEEQGGSSVTNTACAKNFMAFIRRCGIERQWRADGADQFHKELWKAAVREWGYPVWASYA